MKTKKIVLWILCGILLTGVSFGVNAQEHGTEFVQEDRSRPKFVLGFGLIVDSDYKDVIDKVYDDVSGGGAWIDLKFGVQVEIQQQLSITPGINFLFNFMDVEYYDAGGNLVSEDSYTNTIVVPSVLARYNFITEEPTFYASGGLNLNFPSTGSESYDIKSGGLGFEASVGYSFDSPLELEIGYMHLPVTIEPDNENESDENFGGPYLRVLAAF